MFAVDMSAAASGKNIEAATEANNVYLICFHRAKSIDRRDIKFNRFIARHAGWVEGRLSLDVSLLTPPLSSENFVSNKIFLYPTSCFSRRGDCERLSCDFFIISLSSARRFFSESSHKCIDVSFICPTFRRQSWVNKNRKRGMREKMLLRLTAVTKTSWDEEEMTLICREWRHFHYDRFIINFLKLSSLLSA